MVDLGVLASRAAIGSFHLPSEDVVRCVDHVFFGYGYIHIYICIYIYSPQFVQSDRIC